MYYIYLHGFASSPHSKKAEYLTENFAQAGINLQLPDLNAGDFSHLTISRQLAQIASELSDNTPITLIGSSLGGLTAAWLAQKHPQVQRLVLLAPAFGFVGHWLPKLGDEVVQRWHQERYLQVYHHREERELPLHYDFVADAMQYDDRQLTRCVPMLVIHGVQDEVIPVDASRNFSQERPWVELVEVDSDHALNNVLPQIWRAISLFCQLP